MLADADGVVPCDRDLPVTVSIDGPGELAGLGTGPCADGGVLRRPSVTTYDGRALAIVRGSCIGIRTGPGEITVTFSAEGWLGIRIGPRPRWASA